MGGLLGLGFGFSVISAIEIIYFFTIRLYLSSEQSSQATSTKNDVTSSTKDMFSNDKLFYEKSKVMMNGFTNSKVTIS